MSDNHTSGYDPHVSSGSRAGNTDLVAYYTTLTLQRDEAHRLNMPEEVARIQRLIDQVQDEVNTALGLK